jgi:Cd2+/Zn2+-exporting ATPase
MSSPRAWFQDIKRRRLLLLVASGGLILAALVAGNLLGFKLLSNGLMVAAALVAGADIALRAVYSLRNRYVSIELLVTVAALGALVIGEYWEAAAVTFLFILGGYLEARTLGRTRQVLQELLDLAPLMAVVERDGRQVEIAPYEVLQGEVVWVKPGAKLPVDGEVVEGRSAVDESAITGEPMPEDKQPGALVYAGTINENGLLKVRATGIGADTTLARIIRRVEEAQEEQAPTQRFIERFSRWYTPSIIGLSVLFFLFTRNLELSLTLLVIGCPGALVISTPVSVVAGIGRAARSGILIKGGEYLENAGKISALALDKTGTLTQGKPRVTEVVVVERGVRCVELELVEAGAWSVDREAASGAQSLPTSQGAQNLPISQGAQSLPTSQGAQSLPTSQGAQNLPISQGAQSLPISEWSPEQADVLRWAAIAEAGSEHPLARAILSEAHQPIPPADEFESFTGRGVRAVYQGTNHLLTSRLLSTIITVGTLDFMAEQGVQLPEAALESTTVDRHLLMTIYKRLKSRGATAVLVALDGEVVGVLGISDPIRETAAGMVQRLWQVGLKRVVMLTGDDLLTAQVIAQEAGLSEVYAELLPEHKLAVIRKLQGEGHVVAMVGDGVNDAPALAAADIGIAMGAAGTDIAIETADIALISDDLMKIPEAIRLSKATLGNIRQNVVIALVTVAVLLLGVLFGKVHMAGGMLVHQASVLVVILNGMRLLRA